MKITILEKSRIKYRGHYLEPFQTYDDVDDKTAQELISRGEAKEANPSTGSASVTTAEKAKRTPKFDAKTQGFVAQAELTAAEKAKLEAEGKTDNTPVTGNKKDATPDPVEKTQVLDANGKPLSEEEIKRREATVANSASDAKDTKESLQNSGQEVKK